MSPGKISLSAKRTLRLAVIQLRRPRQSLSIPCPQSPRSAADTLCRRATERRRTLLPANDAASPAISCLFSVESHSWSLRRASVFSTHRPPGSILAAHGRLSDAYPTLDEDAVAKSLLDDGFDREQSIRRRLHTRLSSARTDRWLFAWVLAQQAKTIAKRVATKCYG